MHGNGSWRQMRLGLILIITILILAALLGGQALAKAMRVDRPLSRELHSIQGVRRFDLTEGTEGIRLDLSLGRVSDLEQTLDKVLAAVGTRRREAVTEVVIRDNRRGLTGVYYDLRFGVEEALATGRYSALREDLDQLAAQHGLDRARIYLERRFVLVQLEKGSSYLYQVLPRPVAEQKTPGEGGGF